MMRLNSREDNMGIKQEGYDHSQARSLSSLRQNPRIVRVSRLFGGKDRHSKVCTVRGLRDRRIRLSVNTAIQLYDLQDRLGLSQPSKVIDWLLEVAQNDVDLLPPLQFPPGFHHINHNPGESFPGFFQSFDLGGCSRTDQRESFDLEKRKWVQFDQNEDHGGFDMNHHPLSSSIQSSSSYHYNLGQLQQSLLDQSGNVTVAISNNTHNLNQPATENMISPLFPRYPSFLGDGQLQLFSSNSNSSK